MPPSATADQRADEHDDGARPLLLGKSYPSADSDDDDAAAPGVTRHRISLPRSALRSSTGVRRKKRHPSSSNAGASAAIIMSDNAVHRRQRFTASISFLVICAMVLLFKYEEVTTFLFEHEDDVEVKDSPFSSGSNFRLWRPWGTAGSTSISIPTPSELRARLYQARNEFETLLRQDYGDYADEVFNRTAVMKAFHTADGTNMSSSVRLKRRLMIKVIEAALRGDGGGESDGGLSTGLGLDLAKAAEATVDDGVGANNNTDSDADTATSDTSTATATADTRTTFRWITAGHSASAGHGNLINQTYTASVQNAASVFFDALGINFIAESRAAGGTQSGPDRALCMEAYFGNDVDVLWWDFGMTDGGDDYLSYLWGNRVSVHPTAPIMLFYDKDKARADIHDEMDRDGLAAFTLNDIDSLRKLLPDSKNNPDIGKLPPGVAYYMCGGHPENDDVCRDHKWDTEKYCTKGMRFQTSWHNGWKDHLFIGRLAAVLLLIHLEEAVMELDIAARSTALRHRALEEKEEGGKVDRGWGEGDVSDLPVPSISQEYVDHLRTLEKRDADTFASSIISTDQRVRGVKDKNGFTALDEDDYKFLLRSKSFCRPAELPSKARFDGLATATTGDDTKRGRHVGYGRYVGYDEGTEFKALPPPDDASAMASPPTLTWFKGKGNRNIPCNSVVAINVDYKDGFVVQGKGGGGGGKCATDVLPNAAELEAYEGKPDADVDRVGMFVICTRPCDWGRCVLGDLMLDEIGNGGNHNISIVIDGQAVSGVKKVNDRCSVMMKGDSTVRFGEGGKDGRRKGQYEVKYCVNKEGGSLIMSSIVML